MKNKKELIKAYEAGEKLKYLFFWGHRPSPSGEITSSCFSQWWESDFTVDGNTYPTAEHWMMAEKARLFGDKVAEKKILEAASPAAAKALGRQVKGFDQRKWEEMRVQIVVKGNLHKFGQSPELKYFLFGTRYRVLVEASPVDPIWGIGLAADHASAKNPSKWKGLNLLGFALMEVREKLFLNDS